MTRRVYTLLTTALICVGAIAANAAERQTINVTGSSTVAPALMEIAAAYEAMYGDIRIDVQTGGSSKGLADVRSGKSDIGMVSRAPKENETDVKWTRIANDGLAMIVHASNPISKLTSDQVRKLYRRDFKNWSDVGGKDQPVTLVHKAEGRSTLDVFLKALNLKNPDINPQAIVGDNQQGIKTVAANPTAIGYVSVGAATTSKTDGVAIKVLTFDNIPATTQTVASSQYPLLRQLNIVTKGPPPAHVKKFIAFATSPAAAPFIMEQAFVPPQ